MGRSDHGQESTADASIYLDSKEDLAAAIIEESTSDDPYLQAYAASAEASPFETAAALEEKASQAAPPPPPTGAPVVMEKPSAPASPKDKLKIEGAGIAAPGIGFLRMWYENPKKFERRDKILKVLIKAILPLFLALMTATHWDPAAYFSLNPHLLFSPYFIGQIILSTVFYYLIILAVIRFIQWRLTKSFGYARKKRAFNLFHPFIHLAETKIYASGNDDLRIAYEGYLRYYESEKASARSTNEIRKARAQRTAEEHARDVAAREKRDLEEQLANTRATIEYTEEDYRGYYKHKGSFTEDFYRNPDGFFEKDRYENLKKRERELAEEYEKKYGSPS